MDWLVVAADKRSRYERTHGELDERTVVRRGNTAYAAGLALLMAGDVDAAEWFRRAAAHWRESWDLGSATDAWGRPLGALKGSLLAGDDGSATELAQWTIALGAADSPSPIGRYAAALALLVLGRDADARAAASSIRDRDDFPRDVADGLAAVAATDRIAYVEAVESVAESFVDREAYLEDVPVADTALVLQLLARRRGLEHDLPPSAVLPPRRV